MKKIAVVFALLITAVSAVFAQNDLQPLAVVKINKSETITLKNLKDRVDAYKKLTGKADFTIDEKKEILDALIDEKLIVQQAQKEGLNLTDAQVNQYFLANLQQQVGRQATEQEISNIIKETTGMTLEEYIKNVTGYNLPSYKQYLKSQLIAQQYMQSKFAGQMGNVAPTKEEIDKFYDANKTSFVQSDMLKLFLVIVPKKLPAADKKSLEDNPAAKKDATEMYNAYKAKTKTAESIKASKDNGVSFQAGELLVAKDPRHAQQLGVPYDKLLELFTKNTGYVSELQETAENFQFHIILKKYDAKMLKINDAVQPDSNVTVYEYIKQNLGAQKQQQYLMEQIQKLADSLATPENVDRKKTGEALNKLLNW